LRKNSVTDLEKKSLSEYITGIDLEQFG